MMALDLRIGRSEDINNNLGSGDSVVDLSVAKERTEVKDVKNVKDVKDVKEVKDVGGLDQLLHLTRSGTDLASLLPHLDTTALNLLCLVRLQETAAVLSRLQPECLGGGALQGSQWRTVSSTSHQIRRTHGCDQPGCAKVRRFFSSPIIKKK